MKLQIILAGLVLSLSGCSEIESSARLSQDLNRPLVAGVGDTVIEIETRESLPNVFGKADLYGRTRPTGKVFITYLGIEQGRAAFERTTVRLQSNATTMNSTPIIIPRSSTTTYSGSTTFSGTAPGGGFAGSAVSSGTASTRALPIILPPSGSQTQVISNDKIRYYLDLDQDRKIVVEGNVVLIDEATASSVTYRIRKINQIASTPKPAMPQPASTAALNPASGPRPILMVEFKLEEENAETRALITELRDELEQAVIAGRRYIPKFAGDRINEADKVERRLRLTVGTGIPPNTGAGSSTYDLSGIWLRVEGELEDIGTGQEFHTFHLTRNEPRSPADRNRILRGVALQIAEEIK